MSRPPGITNEADILEVITDLSNDEVFTPPKVANAVLDLLPLDVWVNPNLRWLDPACKTGIFLREITRRLMVGLASVIPAEQERLDHILKEMVFGIAITELTSLMSRRTLYCSKDATSSHSTVEMTKPSGNIWFERVEHTYVGGRCSECGASKTQMERDNRDNYAYGFIHANGRSAIEKEFDMRFDVIVGNPPYQMDDEGGHRPVPIYHRFVEQAIALSPRYLLMITPSRWMAGGLGLKNFRRAMLSDQRIRRLCDFPIASEVFAGVEIKGGVSYFLWDRDNPGTCRFSSHRSGEVCGPTERVLDQFDILVRDSSGLPILEKVLKKRGASFTELVASVRPFGDELRSNFQGFVKIREKDSEVKLYMNQGAQRRQYWVDPAYITNNQDLVSAYKIFLPKAGSDGGQKLPDYVIGRSFVAGPNTVCTETYLAIGPFGSEEEAESAFSFLRTRFARFMISLRKFGQDNVPSTFAWVPALSWHHPWSDADLYEKYGITADEQAYIASVVREMPV